MVENPVTIENSSRPPSVPRYLVLRTRERLGHPDIDEIALKRYPEQPTVSSKLRKDILFEGAAWSKSIAYLQGDLNDPGTYRGLGDHLAGLDRKAGTAGNYLFYLAVADRFFSVAISGLGAAGLVDEKQGQWRRVVIEKPFGHASQAAAPPRRRGQTRPGATCRD